jgi:lambda family phage tail tape measure protein
LLKNGKITKQQYGQSTAWLASQFNEAVNSANGLSQALQYQMDLERQLNNQRAQYAAQAAAVGMGSKESDRYLERLELERQTNDQVLSLRTELATATTDQQRKALQDQIDLTNAYLPKQIEAMKEGWAQMDAAQSDWTNGARGAWQDYLDSAKDVAGQTRSLFGNAFSAMEDAAADFATTGKASFSDFTKSILADMARIATRQASSALLSSLIGAGTSYFSGSGAGASAGSTQAGYGGDLSGFSPGSIQAKGGAWASGVQMFAKGGAFTNSVVTQPTAFGMAGGTGLMGEAGPEAIMPLTRTADGSLGVKAIGGSDGGSISANQVLIQQTIEVSGSGNGASSQQDMKAVGQVYADVAKRGAQQAIAQELQPGGQIWRLVNGR